MVLSPEALHSFLNYVADGASYASAMRAIGARSENSLLWVWLKRSTAGDPALLCSWPDAERDPPQQFAKLLTEARRCAILQAESRLRADCDGIERKLFGPNGSPVWKVDAKAIAMWPDAETARDLGGVDDWPFAHDADGARIQETVREPASAALRVHVARSTLAHAGYNPGSHMTTDHRVNGRMLIVNATGAKASDLEARPSYARPDPAVSPLRADLERRLLELKTNGPANPTPRGAVQVMGRPVHDDPAERVREPERKIDPAQHPRAYRVSR
jgi:hypothetical protein